MSEESPRFTDTLLPEGISYGGSDVGGEYYSKDINELYSIALWTEGEESWTPSELEAIARHKRSLDIVRKG